MSAPESWKKANYKPLKNYAEQNDYEDTRANKQGREPKQNFIDHLHTKGVTPSDYAEHVESNSVSKPFVKGTTLDAFKSEVAVDSDDEFQETQSGLAATQSNASIYDDPSFAPPESPAQVPIPSTPINAGAPQTEAPGTSVSVGQSPIQLARTISTNAFKKQVPGYKHGDPIDITVVNVDTLEEDMIGELENLGFSESTIEDAHPEVYAAVLKDQEDMTEQLGADTETYTLIRTLSAQALQELEPGADFSQPQLPRFDTDRFAEILEDKANEAGLDPEKLDSKQYARVTTMLADVVQDAEARQKPFSGEVEGFPVPVGSFQPEASATAAAATTSSGDTLPESLGATSDVTGAVPLYTLPPETSSIASLQNLAEKERKVSTMVSNTFQDATDAAKALQLLENRPLSTKLFERGLLPLEKLTDETYVSALEKSLQDNEKRIEQAQLRDPSAFSNRQSAAAGKLMRTVADTRVQGVYRYRRPHFDTARMYTGL